MRPPRFCGKLNIPFQQELGALNVHRELYRLGAILPVLAERECYAVG